MLKIVFTWSEPVEDEARKIGALLDTGAADIVHIRKPGMSREEVWNLVRQIDSAHHPRLRLHDHFDLLSEFGIGGVHLNSRNPHCPLGIKCFSRSLHSLEELKNLAGESYVTLSPIFDSISKDGYSSNFKLETLKSHIEGKHVVALGGVTPDSLNSLAEAGFFGAAFLGYVWKNNFDYVVKRLSPQT